MKHRLKGERGCSRMTVSPTARLCSTPTARWRRARRGGFSASAVPAAADTASPLPVPTFSFEDCHRRGKNRNHGCATQAGGCSSPTPSQIAVCSSARRGRAKGLTVATSSARRRSSLHAAPATHPQWEVEQRGQAERGELLAAGWFRLAFVLCRSGLCCAVASRKRRWRTG